MKNRQGYLLVTLGVVAFLAIISQNFIFKTGWVKADQFNNQYISQSITQTVRDIVQLKKQTVSAIVFKDKEGVLDDLSLYLKINTPNAQSLKVYLISPSGKKILIADGSSKAVNKNGLSGWFGKDGFSPAESIDLFKNEQVNGTWKLEVNGDGIGSLEQWSLTTFLKPDLTMSSGSGLGTYENPVNPGGCDCRIEPEQSGSTIPLFGLLLVAISVLFLRRK